ncbi:MAG: hypothetical protein O3A01_07275 [bacterium]|nr:hypothetical protein [bacterium]
METEHKLTGYLTTRVPKLLFGLSAFFGIITLFGLKTDAHHAYASYLVAFIFFLGISLSGLFFVIIQHLTRGGWGVLVRRVPEHFMNNIMLMAILFIPILLGMNHLYHWLDPHAAHDHLLQLKAPYLNKPFFIARSVVYFAIWIVSARFFFRNSVQQDYLGGEMNTDKMQKRSAIAILLFALSYTFASFDWIMSLEPHWFSTIFGIYVFANSTLALLCVTILMYLLFRKLGFLKEIVTIEHYHDLGKLAYGFIIFWAYIAFSQYFLIWYANIPEETMWYMPRLANGWGVVAFILVIGHFVAPLFAFMSRHVKRNLLTNGIFAATILVLCLLDVYYVIMPTVSKTFHISVWDISAVLFIGCLYFGVFFIQAGKYSLIPSKDPYIGESINLDNA